MIRGPVLPHAREALWSLVSTRLEAIEQGLTLVGEGFDCSGGSLGAADGLARDAAGAPVLLLLAVEGDALLTARALAAVDFLQRVGDALGPAVPEASLCPGVAGRVLVIAGEASAVLESLLRRETAGLQVCRLEPFRLGGSERFAVRWLVAGQPATPIQAPASGPEFVVPAPLQGIWAMLADLCSRIDGGVRIDGDRYRRRITWSGQLLGEVAVAGGALVGGSPEGAELALASPSDVRAFADRLLRRYARLAGLATPGPAAVPGAPAARSAGQGRIAPPRAPESLRSSLAAARLSPEEYSALGGPASAVGGESGGAAADDVVRVVAAQEGSWSQPERAD